MLFLLAFLGGVLAIASPCILPVIPLVFARSGRSFVRETAPLLVGLAAAFTAAALLATTAIRSLLVAAEVGRAVALVALGGVGIALLSDRFAERVTQPLTRLGASFAGGRSSSILSSFGVGAAIGLLWAPCAGPLLGLVIAAAAASSRAVAAGLFFTFAVGASAMIAVVLALGNRGLARLRRAGVAERVVRRTLGVATVATVVAIALGWDRAVFAKASLVRTAAAEDLVASTLRPSSEGPSDDAMSLDEVAVASTTPALPAASGTLPPFTGATEWINSPPLTPEQLRGKVVLVDFWTFACYNCLNALPHVKELYAKYKDRGLVVIGVHTPELAHERIVENVRREVKRLGISYPVVVDNDYAIWKAYHNQYWPAAYYADATGKIRFYHFGEGRYAEQDQVVAKLLAEAKLASERP
jgi:cytochrome c biogenesis protein CcdA/thiol-disulfide isomerase/thioredoxin